MIFYGSYGGGHLSAAISTNKVQNEVLIHMDGGDLQVYWDNIDKHIYMRGSAEKVFDGTIELDE